MGAIDREAAKALGLTRYFTGRPCGRGHFAQRTVAQGHCCECRRLASKKWKDRNRDRVRANSKKWQRENYDRALANNRAWLKANPEKVAARNERYRLDRSDREIQVSRRWRTENKDRVALYARNRRARKKASEGSHTVEDIRRIERAQGHKCAYCRISLRAASHVDHIKPLARGGGNAPSNLQILCPPCNQRKRSKDPMEFARQQGFLL
jgi:5-methylcytosine-specific restriction endonuclease McrA